DGRLNRSRLQWRLRFCFLSPLCSIANPVRKGFLLNSHKVIGIGIVGAGFARTTQIPGFKNCKDARIVSIASGHRENAEKVAAEFGIEHVANDWQELVQSDDV